MPTLPASLSRSLLTERLTLSPAIALFPRCRPRILVVTDGGLGFGTGGFGLSRFIEAITTDPSVTLRPTLTLAHRGAHASPVNIGGVSYIVRNNLDFSALNPALTVANYDQVWMFGINAGAGISDAEVATLARFMNAGGGVFSTGDHATLGAAMGARLPRIRHMRDWSSVPMGSEALPGALRRIDTVVNPGANGVHEFSDQGDDIPQRIFPNYAVSGAGGAAGWTATVHPLLLLSGAAVSRASGDPTLFANDMDVLPDHPHESECFAVTSVATLNGNYTEAGQNFAEFPPASAGGARFGAEIVAFGVSGGRSVLNNVWKPPVTPRMFGVISAYDGHRAAPLAGQVARPGRITCDSTWHHFVNVNLNGLGTGAGAAFTPGPQLLKIYRYYQNMVSWLQPSNRRICPLVASLVSARFHPDLLEDLAAVRDLRAADTAESIGLGLAELIDAEQGPGSARRLVLEALRAAPASAALADQLDDMAPHFTADDMTRLTATALGRVLGELVPSLPGLEDTDMLKMLADERHAKLEDDAMKVLARAVTEGAKRQLDRLERRGRLLKAVAG